MHQIPFKWSIEDASGNSAPEHAECDGDDDEGKQAGQTSMETCLPLGSPDWTLLFGVSIKTLSLRLNTHIYSTHYT